MLTDAKLAIVTDVGAPGLFVNVAMSSGTVLGGVELQFVPTVHWVPGPVQVPSTACAGLGANMASAPSQTLPSSAARLSAAGVDLVAIWIAPSRSAALGAAGAAARVACERHRYERIPQPLRAAPAAHPSNGRAPSRADE